MQRFSRPKFLPYAQRMMATIALHLGAVFCITFISEDMQVKRKHDRPLYYTGYIGSSKMSRIQVDSRSALSIMPRKVMQHLEILTHRLSATQTMIYGFNANGTRSMGKIKLRCQIGDLKSEVTCYIIDADTSYNLLLGWPWIHHNAIILSTLHQVMKYIDEEGKVIMMIVERRYVQGDRELLHWFPPISRFS